MKHPPLLFLDTECLGLGDAPIWEVAAVRIDANGLMRQQWTGFVEHDPDEATAWLKLLPKSFRDDYERRYVRADAVSRQKAAEKISYLSTGGAIVVGSNPDFDMTRIIALSSLVSMEWHYHPIDVPTLVHGYLLGKGIMPAPPWKSDFLSQTVGVDPKAFDRHTAMGDVSWCMAMWAAVTGE